MMALDRELVDAVEEAVGSAVMSASRVHGGDVAIAFSVDLADDRRVFVKTHLRPLPGFFTTEAAGLAGSVRLERSTCRGYSPYPTPLRHSWSWSGSSAARPGRRPSPISAGSWPSCTVPALPAFGREDRRTTGSRALPNEPRATWVEFYATQPAAAPRPVGAPTAGALPTGVDRRSSSALAGRLDEVRRTGRATGPPPRRPVGRQPTRRRAAGGAG